MKIAANIYMGYYLFIDECGDHGLSNINPAFPIFSLCGIIISDTAYEIFSNELNKLKLKYFNNLDIIFHSIDIRRCERDFKILLNKEIKEQFYTDLNNLVLLSNYKIICTVIDKRKYKRTSWAKDNNVYEIALSFLLERSIFYMDAQLDNTKLHVIAEQRGRKEDNLLLKHFRDLLNNGTRFVTKQRLCKYCDTLYFKNKNDNVNGLQLADLLAYPITTYILYPERNNPVFQLIRSKFYQSRTKISGLGLKIFPDINYADIDNFL